MTVLKVSVKWQKNKYDVDLDTSESPLVFKSQLYALTGVAPDRQKVMTKGGLLKDDDSWESIKVQEGQTWMMMGTVGGDAAIAPPAEMPRFVEDMAEDEIPTGFPTGLQNMGNSCYANATLQCLGSVPELKRALQSYSGQPGLNPNHNLTLQLKELYEELEKSNSAIIPVDFMEELRKIFPQFAETGPEGMYLQQDSSECWQQIMKCMDCSLPGKHTADGGSASSLVEQFFTYQMESELVCEDAPDEPPTHQHTKGQVLQCNISGHVNFMAQGITENLEGTLEKLSSTLGRNATYKKTSRLSRLPAYLTIEFVRFYWKARDKVKAKVLRSVKFPMTLDVYEFCSDDLKQKLLPMRKRFMEQSQREVERKGKGEGPKSGESEAMEVDKVTHRYDFEDDIGSNNSGYYELGAVLTHRGRSADSGHYLAWVREKGDEWLKFDDDLVTRATQEEILKLCGGGDWHMGYMLLYFPKVLTEDKANGTSDSK